MCDSPFAVCRSHFIRSHTRPLCVKQGGEATHLYPLLWLGWLGSNQRDDGIKIRCLTAWRHPNIYDTTRKPEYIVLVSFFGSVAVTFLITVIIIYHFILFVNTVTQNNMKLIFYSYTGRAWIWLEILSFNLDRIHIYILCILPVYGNTAIRHHHFHRPL